MISSDDLVEGESCLVSAAANSWIVAVSIVVELALLSSFKASFDGVIFLVPGVFEFRETLSKGQIALANVSSTRPFFVGTLDGLDSVIIKKSESVADFFADAASFAVVFGLETVVALLEVLAASVNVVHWFAVSATSDVVRSFWQAVASIVAVSAKFLLFLEPENNNFQLSEFSRLDFGDETRFFSATEIEDQLIEFVSSSV